eukprot:1688415-Rhodomonas_salina.1
MGCGASKGASSDSVGNPSTGKPPVPEAGKAINEKQSPPVEQAATGGVAEEVPLKRACVLGGGAFGTAMAL